MSLLKCPECGSEVSSFADFCPHCGCPICIVLKSNAPFKENSSLGSFNRILLNSSIFREFIKNGRISFFDWGGKHFE